MAVLVAVAVVAVVFLVWAHVRGGRMNRDEVYRRLLAKQLVMNEETWTALQKHGVTETTHLRLNFSYTPSARDNAVVLAALLKEKTDYDVRTEDSGLFSRKRSVSGTTQPTTISKAILDQWVDWMVTAGLQCGCEFDGWGTEVPEEAGQQGAAPLPSALQTGRSEGDADVGRGAR